MRPMYAAGVALMIALIGQLILQSAGLGAANAVDIAFVISMVPFALVPYLFLGSLVRARLLAGRRGDQPDDAPQRDAARGPSARRARRRARGPLARARVLAARARGYVDFRGRDYELPTDDPSRAIHTVAREGECVAAIIYDATFRRPRRTSRPWAPPPRSRS